MAIFKDDYIRIEGVYYHKDDEIYKRIMENLQKDTATEWVDCPDCEGKGYITCACPVGRPCPSAYDEDGRYIDDGCEQCEGSGGILITKKKEKYLHFKTDGKIRIIMEEKPTSMIDFDLDEF